jgi:hypothetical protein
MTIYERVQHFIFLLHGGLALFKYTLTGNDLQDSHSLLWENRLHQFCPELLVCFNPLIILSALRTCPPEAQLSVATTFNPVSHCLYSYPWLTNKSFQPSSSQVRFIIYFDWAHQYCRYICTCINIPVRSSALCRLLLICWLSKSIQTQRTTIFVCCSILTLYSNT